MTALAFDTETRGLGWWREDERAFLGTWATAQDQGADVLLADGNPDDFIRRLDAADVVIAHNLPFDTHQVRETTGYDLLEAGKELHDTDLLSRVMYPEGQRKGSRGGHGLKNLSKIHLRADADEYEQKIKELAKTLGYRTLKTAQAYYDIWRAYPEAMLDYAIFDARFTYDLFDQWIPKIGTAEARIYNLEREVQPILIRAEHRGVKVDQSVVEPMHAKFTDEANELFAKLVDQLGPDAMGAAEYFTEEYENEHEDPEADTGEDPDEKKARLNKTEALREGLLRAGVPLYRKTPTGQIATNKFALQEFEQDYPVITDLFDWRRASKFLSTYLDPMYGVEVVHTNFNQCGAWTGRMSSRRPNMQNIPKKAGKEVRAMFVPRPGYSFVVCDYDSIEARFLAHYLGPAGKEYADLIEQGYDPHAWLATHVYGGDYDHYLKGNPGQPERDETKNVTYAICYGAGRPRVADMTGKTIEESGALISKVKHSLPGYHKLDKRIKRKVKEVGHVNTVMGRRNPVNPDKAYVGLNALIQGSAADTMKQGLVYAAEALKEFGGHPLLVVHDEIVAEVPTEYAEQALPVVKEAMESAVDIYPRLIATGSIMHNNYAEE